ncbi:protein YIPF1 isoform X2 [Cylas formicarius]|uniref:protein YIPF1 isoform X2 n=1 Tax=Cylas formicarius TaxID=197179 RepID=UPI0029588D59|nr:protein YIPF1 isoform X2 [Cylas formicarius]
MNSEEQDYPTVHTISDTTTPVPISQIDVAGNLKPTQENMQQFSNISHSHADGPMEQKAEEIPETVSFWNMRYYQKFFDVDTSDVLERILASITPKWDNSLKHHLRTKPDLYGPFWISVTLIFTLAISGNVVSYLHHRGPNFHWKYNFHLVSYAATTICLYVTVIPSTLWGLLKYTTEVVDIEGLGDTVTPGMLELICIYGYSLFIFVPASVLWSIQIDLLQWLVALIAAFISGSVLLLTLMPALRLSKRKFLLVLGIIACHVALTAGFMLYFFHDGNSRAPVPDRPAPIEAAPIKQNVTTVNGVAV